MTPRHRMLPGIHGSTTHVWEYGNPDGDPIILVHGFRGDHHGLEGLAQQLVATNPTIRAIVPDLPGFGASPSIPNIEHTLEAYGAWLVDFSAHYTAPNTVILGHSFGSLVVSAALAQGMPSDRTILINPISAPALEGPRAILTKVTLGYYGVAERLPERAARTLLGHPAIVRAMSIVMAKTHDRVLRKWIHTQHHLYFSKFDRATTLNQAFLASVSHTVREFERAYTMPTLLIVGDRDDITPLSDQLALRDALPHSELVIMPGVGHLVHYEAVPEATDAIHAFLQHQNRQESPA